MSYCIKLSNQILYNSISLDINNRTLVDTCWLNQRPEELIHLLCNLCETDINIANEKKLNIVCKIVELLYYSRNSKLVLPHHFTKNLMSYLQTVNRIVPS